MTGISQMLNHPFVQTLGWSLIHFLWQGILIAILAAVVLVLLRNATAAVRYFVACLAFMLMASSPAVTVWTLNSDGAVAGRTTIVAPEVAFESVGSAENGNVVTAGDLTATLPQSPDGLPDAASGHSLITAQKTELPSSTFEPWLTTLVAGWLFGVTALSLRLVSTLFQVSHLRTQVTSIAPRAMTERVAELTRRLKVSRPVRLAQSVLV
jgi:hypothetical protein